MPPDEMLPLSDRRCVACRPGTPPLTDQEVERLLQEVPGWGRQGPPDQLRRSYRFRDFATALAFVNRIGAVAEAEGHHPEVTLGWGKVDVALWTHAAGGLTENDFILAAKIDRLAADAPGLRRPRGA